MLLFFVKALHGLVVIYMLACLWVIWHYALNGLYRRWLWLALVSLLLEAVIYVAWGFRCPLTDWAVALGDPTGADLLSEWLLLEDVNFVTSGAVFFVAGAVLALRRWWYERRVKIVVEQATS